MKNIKPINIRNLKLNTLLFILAVSFLDLLFSPPVTLAATGDNCSVDITSSLPDTQNWNNITILKGSDGSAWRRGTISSPVDALYLKEGQTSDISALVGAKAPTQFFIYAANEITPGVLKKPGEGVCFEGPVADDAGVSTFSINARAVWGNLGKKLVLDVFYRLPQKYDEISGNTTNDNSQKQSLQLYTFILPRVVDVKLYVPPSSGSNGSNNPLNSTPTKPGKWESENGHQSVGFACQESHYAPQMGKPAAGEDWMPEIYYRLDPANISPRLLGNNFDAVGGNPVEIGIFGQGAANHTHVARLPLKNGHDVADWEALYALTEKSKGLEILKRLLEGTWTEPKSFNPLGGSCSYDKQNIGDLTPENLTKNADSNEMVKAIKTLLTGSGDRNAAAASLSKTYRCLTFGVDNRSSNFLDMSPEYILGLFPSSGDSSWTDDFLNILLFWTGSTTGNTCVLKDNDDWNLYDTGKYADFPTYGSWHTIGGGTPLILLNTTDPITLTPDFENTRIVYSEKQFTDGTGWALPAGTKRPFYYRYDFAEPFTKARAGTMCAKKANLHALTTSISKAYKLTPDETATLSRELAAQFPLTPDFVKISLANPADIASRISWLGNGKPLAILQLFFDFIPGACKHESFTPPSIKIPSDRDGFEVGII